MKAGSASHYIFPVVLLACFGALMRAYYVFSVSDTATGYFDDGVMYLLVSEIYSPYYDLVSPSYLNIYENYLRLPPGFPLVLALSGANASFWSAHLLVYIQLICLVVAYFLLASRVLENRYLGAFACMMFLVMPGSWIENLKVLSENQYGFLTFLVLYLVLKYKAAEAGIRFYIFIGVMTLAAVLTRSIGVSLVAALVAGALLGAGAVGSRVKHALTILAITALGSVVWKAVRPASAYTYFEELHTMLAMSNPLEFWAGIIHDNVVTFVYMLGRFGLIYWTDWFEIKTLLIFLFFTFSAYGIFIRRKLADALYVLFYLAIIAVWPYTEDMSRFIYPVMPLLIVYAILAVRNLLRGIKLPEFHMLWMAAVYLAVLSPTLGFLHERFSASQNVLGQNVSHAPVVYTEVSSAVAYSSAYEGHMYMLGVRSLKGKFDKNVRVLSLKPEILALMADITADRLPSYNPAIEKETYLKRIVNSNATHVLVSNMKFTSDPMGMKLLDVIDGITEPYLSIKSDRTNQDIIVVRRIKRSLENQEPGSGQVLPKYSIRI